MLKSWKVEKQIGRRAERWKSGNGGRTDRKRANMLKSWKVEKQTGRRAER